MSVSAKEQAISGNTNEDKQFQENAIHIKSFFRGTHRTPVIQYWCHKAPELISCECAFT